MKFQIVCILLVLALASCANAQWSNLFFRSNQNRQPPMNSPSISQQQAPQVPQAPQAPQASQAPQTPQVPLQLGECPLRAALVRMFPFLNEFETPRNLEQLTKSVYEDLQLVSSRVSKRMSQLSAEVQTNVRNALDGLQSQVNSLTSAFQELSTMVANARSADEVKNLISFLTSRIMRPMRRALGHVQRIAIDAQISDSELLSNTFKSQGALFSGLFNDLMKMSSVIRQLISQQVGQILSSSLFSNLNTAFSNGYNNLYGGMNSLLGSANARLGGQREIISALSNPLNDLFDSFWQKMGDRALQQWG